jgi:DNA-binding IscR family transcriptional regulator
LLKGAGLVESERGVNAGWRLAKRPEVITLRDIYHAVENAPLFGLHAVPPDRNCPIGQGVQSALKKIYGMLEEQLRGRLSKITLAQVFADTMR